MANASAGVGSIGKYQVIDSGLLHPDRVAWLGDGNPHGGSTASHCPWIEGLEEKRMTYVVTENCIKCKYTDCVSVCPVDAFREGPEMLVIDPEACIDCDVCVAECPAGAIFDEHDVPEDQTDFIELNSRLAEQWPMISEMKDPPADAEEWDGVPDKRSYLE